MAEAATAQRTSAAEQLLGEGYKACSSKSLIAAANLLVGMD